MSSSSDESSDAPAVSSPKMHGSVQSSSGSDYENSSDHKYEAPTSPNLEEQPSVATHYQAKPTRSSSASSSSAGSKHESGGKEEGDPIDTQPQKLNIGDTEEDSDADLKSHQSRSSDNDQPEHPKSPGGETSEDEIKTAKKSGVASALFGDDMSTSEDDGDHSKQGGEDEEKEITNADDIVGPRMYADPDEEAMELEEDTAPTQIDLEMARCRADLGQQGAFHVKFPNFLSVETKPFDPETYEDEIEDESVVDEEGRARLKLKIENTVRWRMRKDEHGNEIKESNAKIVKWSDGTMSLYLGNEIFDVEKDKIPDHNHLYIRQGPGLQAQAVFKEKLVFRPFSTDTLTHRKMTMNMADKSNKAQKVKVIADVGSNPEKEKQESIRREEERLRANARRESHQRRVRDRPRVTGLSSNFLEGGYDSDDDESLAAIKKNYQRAADPRSSSFGAHHRSNYASDSDEEAQAREKAKRIGDAKIDSDESESDGESRRAQKSLASATKRKIVIEDEDEE